jgi:hypothetical protein
VRSSRSRSRVPHNELVRRRRRGHRPEHRVVTQPDAEIAVPTIAVSTDHHERSRRPAGRDGGLCPVASRIGVDESPVVDRERVRRRDRWARRRIRGLWWAWGDRRRRTSVRQRNRLVGSPVHQRADGYHQHREQDRRSAERQAPAQQKSAWGRLLTMSAARSGRLRQIPRAGDQGRSHHATAFTGCANILHEMIRRENAWRVWLMRPESC